MFGIELSRLIAASVIMAVMTISGLLLVSGDPADAAIGLFPQTQIGDFGDTVISTVVVESRVPVNVFAGELHFDPTRLAVESIVYNESIADLWAEAPWYENGDGTITFAGGSTQTGGFTGEGALLTITFRTLSAGKSVVTISNAQVLKHDGLGTEANLALPLESIFTIADPALAPVIIATTENETTAILIAPPMTSHDLNSDGKQSIADISVWFLHYVSGDIRGDFTGDGKTTTADLSILLETLSLSPVS